MNELPSDTALRDRIFTIEVPGYELKDKINIVMNYFLPKALKNINVPEKYIVISSSVAEYLIKQTKDWENCNGVRPIEQLITNIVTKIDFLVKHKGFNLSFDIAVGKSIKYPVTLTNDIIKIMC